MSPGEIGTLLFFVPYGVLLGVALSSPLSGAVSYLLLAVPSLLDYKRGVLSWGRLFAYGVVSFVVGFIVSF